jgi:hypothetical protein
MWRDELGARADIHGQRIRINGVDTGVTGVAPKWLEGLYRDRPVDIWIALQDKGEQGIDDGDRNLWLLARLRRNVSAGQAQSAVRRIREVFASIRVLPYTGMTPEMMDGLDNISSLLDAATGGVFFIACANIVSFLLGRAFARSHETSLCVALGAIANRNSSFRRIRNDRDSTQYFRLIRAVERCRSAAPPRIGNSHRSWSATMANPLSGTERRRSPCVHRLSGRHAGSAGVVANAGSHHIRRSFATLIDLASRAAHVGDDGLNCGFAARAPRYDHEPTFDYARRVVNATLRQHSRALATYCANVRLCNLDRHHGATSS